MAFIDSPGRVAITVAAPGSTAFALTGATAVTDYIAPAAIPGIADGDTFPYVAVCAGVGWERGIATYNTASGGTLTRTVFENSSGGSSALNLTGSTTIYAAYPGIGQLIKNSTAKVAPLVYATKLSIYDTVAGKYRNTTVGDLAGSGITTSASVTLTATSEHAQLMTPTKHGEFFKMPDATGMPKGTPLFELGNGSEYFIRILDNAGTLRGFLPPFGRVTCSLADISTAAGGWMLNGAMLYGVGAELRSTTMLGSEMTVVSLDANRTLLLLASADIVGIVYDASTNTWGSTATVRTSVNQFNAVKVSSTQALVISCSATTAMECVSLSISGTTITVDSGTKGTATLAGNLSNLGDFQVVGSTYVVSYSRATTTQGVRCVSLSGTTPSIGAEVTVSTTAVASSNSTCPHVYVVDSTHVLVMGNLASGSTLFANPYSISGNTLTLGTGVALGTATASFAFRTLILGTRWLIFWNEGASGTTLSAALISVNTGTNTATASTVTSVVTNLTAGVDPGAVCDIIAISSTKVLVAGSSNATVNGLVNLLTDAAGTLSKGTAVTAGAGNVAIAIVMGFSGTNVRVMYPSTATAGGAVVTYDCSGSSPVRANGIENLSVAMSPAQTSYRRNSVRHPTVTRSGAGWAGLMPSPNVAAGAWVPIVGANTINGMIPPWPVAVVSPSSLFDRNVLSDYDSFFVSGVGTSSNGGALIQRIMGAQP